MESVRQAHDRLLNDHSFQFRFPAPAPEQPLSLPDPAPVALGPGAFWVVVAVVAAVLLALAVQAIRSRGLPGVSPAPDDTLPDAAARALAPQAVQVPASVLADADALAQAGAYGDAVHALLLRGVGALQERFPRVLLPAHTSRDIAALTVLPPALAHAFAGIAASCERAVFAGRPLEREDWEACRALYAGLLGPGTPRGTPS